MTLMIINYLQPISPDKTPPPLRPKQARQRLNPLAYPPIPYKMFIYKTFYIEDIGLWKCFHLMMLCAKNR